MMATDPNKTVFISYRRSASRHLARSIFMDLTHQGYDVFLDVNTIDSGAFDSIILNQIGARTHFIILLSPTALERCVNDNDWLRQEIQEAMRLGRNIVPLIEEGFDFERETGYLPAEWRDQFRRLSGMRLLHDYFEEGMTKLRERFLKPPQFRVELKTVSTQEQHEVKQRIAQVTQQPVQPPPKIETPPPKIIAPTRKSLELMPKPFAWVDIPAGKVTLVPDETGKKYSYLKADTTFDVGAFQMSKYLITNAQFDIFVNHADGYENPAWWDFSDEAKSWRKENPKPQNTGFAGESMPRTKVSWYESIAFCRWMSSQTGENITLPTEQEWQWAAQGRDGRAYPWGNEFYSNRCNTKEAGIGKTTPVTQYEGKGDSPFGVVDMSGNVLKWCLTEYGNRKVKLIGSGSRIVRGGSWSHVRDGARASYRNNHNPNYRGYVIGFFVVRRPY